MKIFERFLSLLLAFLIGVFANVNVLIATHHSTHTPYKTTNHEEYDEEYDGECDEDEYPTVTESWKKLISLQWNKLSSDDAQNIIGPVVIVVGACIIIKNLKLSPAQNMNQATQQQAYHDQTAQLQQQQMAQARQELYNQLIQPYHFDYASQRQQLMNQYHQQIVPGIARRFGGTDGMNSSAFRNASLRAEKDLLTDLRALEEQGRMREAELNQQRLIMLAQYFPNGL